MRSHSTTMTALAAAATLMTASAVLAEGPKLAADGKPDVSKVLGTIDERMTSPGDLKWLAYWSDFDKGQKKPRETVEAVIYRRDNDDALVLLILAPKTHAGEGYLRLTENLFSYAPSTGQWIRTTLRERVASSQMRTFDLDTTRFTRDYSASYVGREKVAAHAAHRIRMTAKKDAKVGYSRVEVWVDEASGDLLKRVDMSDDGKLVLRTVYFRGWQDHPTNTAKKVRLPSEIHFLDNLTGERTSFFSKKLSFDQLEPNLFTKAWLESKTR